jgi:geranylgeranyl reductase family protein
MSEQQRTTASAPGAQPSGSTADIASHCDVLIVGGGPAGSTCARLLVRAGLDVIVLDKAAFPRDKVCAGWITPQVVDELEMDLEDYRRGRVLQPISGFITGIGERAARPVGYERIVSYGIRRCEFDHYLLERSGARLELGQPFKSMAPDGDGWIVNGRTRARLIVGAGGHFCPVARALGAQLGKDERAICAQEIELEMTPEEAQRCAVAEERPELYFCEDLKGYGWCFRKGAFLNVGLGREGNEKLTAHVHAFGRWLVDQGRIPARFIERFKGHAYLLYSHAARRVVGDRVLLIGDAAGLAYPQSGEGIRPAVESGIMAAEVIVAAAGDYSARALAAYEARLHARFGARTDDAGAKRWIPQRLRAPLARVLMRREWFNRRIVLDQWFLHADQPALKALR